MATEAHGAEEGGLVFHPMDQFIVEPLFGEGAVSWYTVTNATLWMFLAVVATFALLVLGSSKRALVPSRMQSVAELAYGFVYKMVEDICGKEGVKFFPYIMTLFMFIVCANFLGLIPTAFTPAGGLEKKSSSAASNLSDIALRLPGRFMVTVAMPSSDRSTFTISSDKVSSLA